MFAIGCARRGTGVLLAAVILAGCQTAPPSLYEWGDYQSQVYRHFQGGSPEEQIATMEASYQKIRASGKTPPPGFHAHLGMLYANVGQSDQAVQEFKTEKALFPESGRYMDFLLSKYVSK
ncbi:DUF4810 domain-containing protein [Uliginosibacterium sp. sgz301328]|uniref:DUF4810 domain-containing protein n=1 Tax=Uliginosibacterium sp. sgz301328 TaxID=3243764 RepID=UPI00359DF54F